MLNKIGKAFRSKVKTKLRRGDATPADGLPKGINFETVSRICSTNFGETLQRTTYVPASGRLTAGEYRLFLETRSERLLTLIYKEVIIEEGHFPSLPGILIAPGPPECAIYRSGSSRLLHYLPAVYLCDEIIPRKHYHYILEDLEQDYREPASKDDFYLMTRQLPKIHLALREWLESGGEDELIRYEGAHLESLHEFSRAAVDAYLESRESETADRIRSSWKRIMQLLDRKNFFEFVPMRPIHGDFIPENIRIHRENTDDIKLINWEWAGIGIPHADLASLLKDAPRQIEEDALDGFVQHIKGWTTGDQIKLYWSCKLERGLFDAALLAAQHEAQAEGGGIDYRADIESALQRAMHAYEQLT
jgi:thiamine kinase-like enzyme